MVVLRAMKKTFVLNVGAVFFTAIILVVMTSCVNHQTINVTGNNNSVGQSRNGSAIGEFINAPGIDEFARGPSCSSGYRGSSAPRCMPERPCSQSDYLYFRREEKCRRMEQRIPPPPMMGRGYQESRHQYHQGGYGQQRPCPPGSRLVQAGGYGTRVLCLPNGEKRFLELGPDGQPTGRPGRPPGQGAKIIGSGPLGAGW